VSAWVGSLRLRLLGITVLTLVVALLGAQLWLSGLFREHVLQQFDAALSQQLDQLTARLEFDASGLPIIGPRGMSDPRWEKAYSGLYWQVQRLPAKAGEPGVVIRSRSLWDAQLMLPADTLDDGSVHRHDTTGPQGERLRAVERSLQAPEPVQSRWRLVVAGDLRDTEAAIDRFSGLLGASLAVLGLLLAITALAQVGVGLYPLKAVQQGLQKVREGQQQRLQGRFPQELQPLIDEFNGVLDRNTEIVERARAQAGNLAHALKTPLAILNQAADQAPPDAFSALVREQVGVAQRQMQWHLARARAAATSHVPGQRTTLQPVLASLLRAMVKLHAERHLQWVADPLSPELAFAGEEQDLQEMLGNVLDNAGRSARGWVGIHASREARWLRITVDDDGPGIAPAQRAAVLQRGVRLDESREGSGLGLAIVVDLARLYGGDVTLEAADAGGLRVRLSLPAAG
jgi:signal transduction histidine kinase